MKQNKMIKLVRKDETYFTKAFVEKHLKRNCPFIENIIHFNSLFSTINVTINDFQSLEINYMVKYMTLLQLKVVLVCNQKFLTNMLIKIRKLVSCQCFFAFFNHYNKAILEKILGKKQRADFKVLLSLLKTGFISASVIVDENCKKVIA